jgi:hypothetical protein
MLRIAGQLEHVARSFVHLLELFIHSSQKGGFLGRFAKIRLK